MKVSIWRGNRRSKHASPISTHQFNRAIAVIVPKNVFWKHVGQNSTHSAFPRRLSSNFIQIINQKGRVRRAEKFSRFSLPPQNSPIFFIIFQENPNSLGSNSKQNIWTPPFAFPSVLPDKIILKHWLPNCSHWPNSPVAG